MHTRAFETFGILVALMLLSPLARAGGDPIPVCLSAQGTIRVIDFGARCAAGETKMLFAEWEQEIEEPEEEDPTESLVKRQEERIRVLTKQVQDLSARLAAVERGAKEASADAGPSEVKSVRPVARVTAPFEVVSRSGVVILRVAEKVSSASGEGARVTIGAGDSGNYSLRVHRDGRQLVAGIGQSREGSGLVVVMDDGGQVAANLNGRDRKVSVFDGEHAAASMSAESKGGTVAVYDGSQAVAYLTRSSHGNGGNLTLSTSAGFGVFSAGAASDGGGEACLNRVTGGGHQRNVCLGIELPSMGLGK